jgi:hypothetical protein
MFENNSQYVLHVHKIDQFFLNVAQYLEKDYKMLFEHK